MTVWVWGAVVAADVGLRTRCGWGILAPLCLAALVGCGSPGPVLIPKASPTPKPATTALAPGVRVPESELQLPAYTVSLSHPLPSGVSAALVVKDVQIDNLLENIAIERQDPALLQYADSGDWLLAEKGEIASNQRQGLVVVSIRDNVATFKLGSKVDPKDPSVMVAVILSGTELRSTLAPGKKPSTSTTKFAALLWLRWSGTDKRYLICDAASS